MSLDHGFPDLYSDQEIPTITFFSEDLEFQIAEDTLLSSWIQQVIEHHSCKLVGLQVIFCSDDYLLEINKEHLDHHYYTDIITFPYQDPPEIEGDLFISIDRVRDNASDLKHSFKEELHRVIIHGVLHLCGFGDKSEEESKKMRFLENEALSMLSKLE